MRPEDWFNRVKRLAPWSASRQQPTNQTFQIVIFAPRWGNARLFCLFGWMANKKKVSNLDARAHHAHHRRNRATMKMKT